MQQWILDEMVEADDIGFINGCGINYTITDDSRIDPADSGWCDATTGGVLLNRSLRLVFDVTSERDLLVLKTKYTDAIKPYTILAGTLPDS